MLAAFYTHPGAPRDVIRFGEQPRPVAGPGEVLVRLHTSGVNPSDWKNRRHSPTGAVLGAHGAAARQSESPSA